MTSVAKKLQNLELSVIAQASRKSSAEINHIINNLIDEILRRKKAGEDYISESCIAVAWAKTLLKRK